LDGTTLKVCVAHAGGERPTGFSTKEGSRQTCYVLKKEK
jgi:hypothetical protein